ncbi:MAG: hypothetical protein IJY82_07785 [Oscillospiraceae bacterium]|nr:hypothetical protein [Oscillospiraceae bacterium]
MKNSPSVFFLSAQTSSGFVSFAPSLTGNQPLLLQLYCGRDADAFAALSQDPLLEDATELYLSPFHSGQAGFSSRDGTTVLVGSELSTLPADLPAELVELHIGATPPHLTPTQREKLLSLHRQMIRQKERHIRYLSAAASLLGENRRLAECHLDREKLKRFADRFCQKYLPPRKSTPGNESFRFLSAEKEEGHFLEETARKLAPRLTVLEDEFGAVSTGLMAQIRGEGLRRGYDAISCFCPVKGVGIPEHLFFPQAGIGLLTSNSFHAPQRRGEPRIRAARFLAPATLRPYRQRMRFNRKAARELLFQGRQVFAELLCLQEERDALVSSSRK